METTCISKACCFLSGWHGAKTSRELNICRCPRLVRMMTTNAQSLSHPWRVLRPGILKLLLS